MAHALPDSPARGAQVQAAPLDNRANMGPLQASAAAVERNVHEVYENQRFYGLAWCAGKGHWQHPPVRAWTLAGTCWPAGRKAHPMKLLRCITLQEGAACLGPRRVDRPLGQPSPAEHGPGGGSGAVGDGGHPRDRRRRVAVRLCVPVSGACRWGAPQTKVLPKGLADPGCCLPVRGPAALQGLRPLPLAS